jgi:rhamnose utilization protein RhaD (predicted bifunctional aldolase and dehydrogenase)
VDDLATLLAISGYAGGNLCLAQGGGGNTSVKAADGGWIWIKASGFRLAELRAGHGYLAVDLPALLNVLRDPALRALPPAAAHLEAERRVQAAVLDRAAPRPSLETTFHAGLGRVVLHTHPVYANAFTCMAGGQALLADATGGASAWVPYAAPGYALGMAVDDVRARPGAGYSGGRALVWLENHGVIASGETAEAVIALTEAACRLGERVFGALPAEALATAAPPAGLAAWAEALAVVLRARPEAAPAVVRPARYSALNAAAADPPRWLSAGPLVPDDVVYAGRQVWAAPHAQPAAAWLEAAGGAAALGSRWAVAVTGLGVVLAAPSERYAAAMEENLLAHVLVRRLIARRGAAQSLPAAEVDYLVNMESEAYRQAVAEMDEGPRTTAEG